MTDATRGRYLVGLLDAEADLLHHIADIIAAGLPIDRQRFADVLIHVNAARRLLGLKVTRWPVETSRSRPDAPAKGSTQPAPR